jgi:hypothetical protein
MSFIRPDVAKSIKRFQEVLWGALVVVIGLWAAYKGGFFAIISVPIFIVGFAMIYFGARRIRLMTLRGNTPMSEGVVDVVEREITFLTGGQGARIPMDNVVKIEIETNDLGPFEEDVFWMFYQKGGAPVSIPNGAVGSEQLIDALVEFPGADNKKVIEAMGSTANNRFLIWHNPSYPSPRMLH